MVKDSSRYRREEWCRGIKASLRQRCADCRKSAPQNRPVMCGSWDFPPGCVSSLRQMLFFLITYSYFSVYIKLVSIQPCNCRVRRGNKQTVRAQAMEVLCNTKGGGGTRILLYSSAEHACNLLHV